MQLYVGYGDGPMYSKAAQVVTNYGHRVVVLTPMKQVDIILGLVFFHRSCDVRDSMEKFGHGSVVSRL